MRYGYLEIAWLDYACCYPAQSVLRDDAYSTLAIKGKRPLLYHVQSRIDFPSFLFFISMYVPSAYKTSKLR